MVSPWNTYDCSYHSWDRIACQITARASGNISQLDAVIADLPTRRRQFRLITPGEGCVHTLPTEDRACNMIADNAALHEPKKVFFNLQLRGFLFCFFHRGSLATVLIIGLRLEVDTQPIKVCRILPVMHPGVLDQHVASASLQEVHIEKNEGAWSNPAISSCSSLIFGLNQASDFHSNCELFKKYIKKKSTIERIHHITD